MTLSEIQVAYEDVMKADLSDELRDKALATLMTHMEREYRIPALANPEWEEKNKAVIAMYRKLSMSRTTV